MDSGNAVTNIVVTCANRKRFEVPSELTVRSLGRLPLRRRAEKWIDRLTSLEARSVPAIDLYAGEHWSVVRSLADAAAAERRPIAIWVVSAGYGLISSEALIHPYAATFSAGHADSVALDGARADWWRDLSEWTGPEPGAPRSLTQLARRTSGSAMVVAVSPPYLEACSDDLVEAAEVASRDFSLICTGASNRALRDYTLPGDARLQHSLGGTRQALNARVLAYLLREHRGPLRRDKAMRTMDALLSQQPPLIQHDRQRCSDADVTRFIRKRLRSDASFTRSRLLRELRDHGRACEQRRFTRLFESAKSR
jgi:hypothetical protein